MTHYCANCSISNGLKLVKFTCTASICSNCIQNRVSKGFKRIVCNSCNKQHNIGLFDSSFDTDYTSNDQLRSHLDDIPDDLIDSFKKIEYDPALLDKLRLNKNYKNYLSSLKASCKSNNLNLLHLNINSLFNKEHDLSEILALKCYDVVCLNETKIDDSTKLQIQKHPYYNMIRRDRSNNGGGILALIRKEYKIIQSFAANDYEALYFQLNVAERNLNFIVCYRPPSTNESLFIESWRTSSKILTYQILCSSLAI